MNVQQVQAARIRRRRRALTGVLSTPTPDAFVAPASAGTGLDERAGDPGDFDPAEHNVTVVMDYADQYPEQCAAILGREMLGKNRKSVIGPLQARLAASTRNAE